MSLKTSFCSQEQESLLRKEGRSSRVPTTSRNGTFHNSKHSLIRYSLALMMKMNEGDEGIQKGEMRCSEGLVEGFTETERESPRDPWPCTSDSTLEPLKEEDAMRKHCREGLYHPKIKACVQARGHRRPHAKSLERMFKMV